MEGIIMIEELTRHLSEALLDTIRKHLEQALANTITPTTENFSVETNGILLQGEVIEREPWFKAMALNKSLGLANSAQTVREFCHDNEVISLRTKGKGRPSLHVSFEGALKIIVQAKSKKAYQLREKFIAQLITLNE